MARIIGGIGASHTPTIAFAHDRSSPSDPVWGPVFEAFKPVRAWIAEKKPDVLFLIYNDHLTSFFFDHYSTFALGLSDKFEVADEGGGPRKVPPVPGHSKLAAHIGASLVADEFDMSYFQDKPLDHGCLSPLSMMYAKEEQGKTPIIPLQVGVLQFPIPTAKRCFKLGQSLRKAIETYPEDLKVAVVATGGLSHQVHGERCGFNNTEWDMRFLEMFEKDPEALTKMTIAEFAELGGVEGAEIVMWMIMRGAMPPKVNKVHQAYCLPSMTAIATVIYEPAEQPVPAGEEYIKHVKHQLAGVEKLEGSYPFTLERSAQSYNVNKMLHRLIEPDYRARFLADKDSVFKEAGLTAEQSRMIRDLDWRAMIHHGVNFFMLEKLAAVVGKPNAEIYAGMRGTSLDEFLSTRNTRVLYSVAGDADKSKDWDSSKEKA